MKRPLRLILLTLLILPAAGAAADVPPTLDIEHSGPIELETNSQATARSLWLSLGKAYGFDVVFSPRLKDVPIATKWRAGSVTEALDRLALLAGQMWIPLNDHTVMVASDTPQNRRAYTPQMVRSFRLENMELKDAMTTVRSLYGLKHVTADVARQTLTVRDVPAKIQLTERLLGHLDVPSDEVSVGVELVGLSDEVDLSSDRLESLSNSGHLNTLLTSDLNVVGDRKAGVSLKERSPETGNLLSFDLELSARAHPSDREVTLDVSSRIAQIAKTEEAAIQEGRLMPQSQETNTSWRVASGEPLVIHLPGRLNGSDQKLALVLRPVIRHARDRSHDLAWLVGTERNFTNPTPRAGAEPTGSKPLGEAERAEIRDRLKSRLTTRQQKENPGD